MAQGLLGLVEGDDRRLAAEAERQEKGRDALGPVPVETERNLLISLPDGERKQAQKIRKILPGRVAQSQ